MLARLRIATFGGIALTVSVAFGGVALAQAPPIDDDAVLREAEKIEYELVRLIAKVQESTVAVINYKLVELDGQPVEMAVGQGSGVIVAREGKIFTNVHVVEGHARIDVVLHDGRVMPAKEYAEVSRFDFALLLVKGGDFRPAEWAKSERVEPGQLAIAAGNPRGLGRTGHPIVTLGIVSGAGRTLGGGFEYLNAIQTDAEINKGNSGGPLFDSSGRIIGINGKIISDNPLASSVGLGFTIPAQQVLNFLPSMYGGGKVEPGYSGLIVENAMHQDGGIPIRAVFPNSPAAKAGVKEGDRITALNGRGIDSYTEWLNRISMQPGGASISLTFVRKDRTIVKKFELEQRSIPLDAR